MANIISQDDLCDILLEICSDWEESADQNNVTKQKLREIYNTAVWSIKNTAWTQPKDGYYILSAKLKVKIAVKQHIRDSGQCYFLNQIVDKYFPVVNRQ